MKQDWCNIWVSVPWRSIRHFRDLRIWLIENVSELDYDFDGADPNNRDNRIYWFARKEDAIQFALRWS